jgi:hypothetical protein
MEHDCISVCHFEAKLGTDTTQAEMASYNSTVVFHLYQGGNFGKKYRSCRPTADPTKKIKALPTDPRSDADFSQSADFADLPIFPNPPILPIRRFCRFFGDPDFRTYPKFSDFFF